MVIEFFKNFKLQVSRNADQYPAFFAVYNMETSEIISFYQVPILAHILVVYCSLPELELL